VHPTPVVVAAIVRTLTIANQLRATFAFSNQGTSSCGYYGGLSTAGLAAASIGSTALIALVTEAQAAPACAAFGGLYAGASVGYGSYDTTWTDRDNWADRFNTDIGLDSIDKRDNGVTLGAQGGYNHQSGCALLGIEADWSWTNIDDTKTYTGNGDPTVLVVTHVDELNWFGSVRGRAGVVVDQLLLYATVGVAFADIEHFWSLVDNGPSFEAYGDSDTRWGFTAGGGGEWQLGNQLSIKGEALFTSFNDETTTAFSPAAGFDVRWDNLDSLWVARVGLNYHFSM
jgi:outer membrane immunogenic protein